MRTNEYHQSGEERRRYDGGDHRIEHPLYDEWSVDEWWSTAHELDDANLILEEEYEVMDHHIDDDGNGEYEEPEEDIYRNLKDMEHLDHTRDTIVLTAVVEELTVEWSLIILEDITESPYIHIEWSIEIDINIGKADTIGKWIGISLYQCREIRIASREESEGILARDIVHLHSWECRSDAREELDRAYLWVIISILEIDIDRYTVIDRGDEPVSREYHQEEDMHEEYEESYDQEWWGGEPDIAEDIAESIADELHEVIFLDSMSWLYRNMRKSELEFDKRERKRKSYYG